MKTFLSLVISFALICPLTAGGHHGGRGGFGGHGGRSGFNHGGHEHFEFNHERHEGWRGNHGCFNGFGGTFYGQIVILDNGCYFWNGLAWEITDCD